MDTTKLHLVKFLIGEYDIIFKYMISCCSKEYYNVKHSLNRVGTHTHKEFIYDYGGDPYSGYDGYDSFESFELNDSDEVNDLNNLDELDEVNDLDNTDDLDESNDSNDSDDLDDSNDSNDSDDSSSLNDSYEPYKSCGNYRYTTVIDLITCIFDEELFELFKYGMIGFIKYILRDLKFRWKLSDSEIFIKKSLNINDTWEYMCDLRNHLKKMNYIETLNYSFKFYDNTNIEVFEFIEEIKKCYKESSDFSVFLLSLSDMKSKNILQPKFKYEFKYLYAYDSTYAQKELKKLNIKQDEINKIRGVLIDDKLL